MGEKEIARNKKAYHNFSIEERYEAGMSLLGSEIKSLRKGKVQLKDSYISFKNGEAFIKGMNIARYESSSAYFNHEEERDRRLLLHKDEIIKIASKQKNKRNKKLKIKSLKQRKCIVKNCQIDHFYMPMEINV